MRRLLSGVSLVAVVALASAGGYWLGRMHEDARTPASALVATAPAADSTPAPAASPQAATGTPATADASKNGKILYYKDPMGKPDYSPVPKKDSMGMDYIPVYEGQDDNAQPEAAAATPAAKGQGKILYYRNPM